MTKEKMYEAIGEISERHIKDAMEYRRNTKHIFIKWALTAACIVLAIFIVPMSKKTVTTTYESSLNVNHINDYQSYAADIDMISYRQLDKEGFAWIKNEFASAIGIGYDEFIRRIPNEYGFLHFGFSRTAYSQSDGSLQTVPHTYFFEYGTGTGRVSIGLSSVGKPARCIVIPEENYKLSEIEGVPVLVLMYGNAGDLIAEFKYRNVNYYIDAKGISTEKLKELLCSIIQ